LNNNAEKRRRCRFGFENEERENSAPMATKRCRLHGGNLRKRDGRVLIEGLGPVTVGKKDKVL